MALEGLQGAFLEGFSMDAHLRVLQDGFAQFLQEVYADLAHFFAPLPCGYFIGGVVAGAGGFAHVAGFALGAEVFRAQGAIAKAVDCPFVYEGAQRFDEVAGERFASV